MSRTAQGLKGQIIFGGLVSVLLIIGGTFAVVRTNNRAEKPFASQTVEQPTKPGAEVKADYVSYQGQEGKNALELLKISAPGVQTKSSSYGEFVASINGQDGGGTKYWTFYVNGEMAQVGAGSYATKSTDKIEWKLQ